MMRKPADWRQYVERSRYPLSDEACCTESTAYRTKEPDPYKSSLLKTDRWAMPAFPRVVPEMSAYFLVRLRLLHLVPGPEPALQRVLRAELPVAPLDRLDPGHRP